MNEVEETDMDDGGESEGTVCGDVYRNALADFFFNNRGAN